MIKHIHVLNTHGLGDVVMTLPMLREIDKDGHRITMTVKSKIEAQLVGELFKPETAKIEFLYFQKYKKQGPYGLLKFAVELFKLGADLILPAIGVSKPHYNLLAFFSRAKFRVGHGGKFSFLNHFNWNKTQGKHKVELNCDIYRQSKKIWGNVECNNTKLPEFPLFKANHTIFGRLKDKYPALKNERLIGIAPGSGEVEKHKRWPIDNYSALTSELIKKGYSVIVIGGPGEEALGEAIAIENDKSDSFLDLTGKLTLPETIQLVAQLQKIVVNCNGMSHIASAVDINIVGIYGPTDPYYTGPFSNKLQVITQNLDCAPCYKRGFITGCGKPVCVENIMVTTILKNI